MPTVYYYYFFFNQTFFLCFAWGNLNCDSVLDTVSSENQSLVYAASTYEISCS